MTKSTWAALLVLTLQLWVALLRLILHLFFGELWVFIFRCTNFCTCFWTALNALMSTEIIFLDRSFAFDFFVDNFCWFHVKFYLILSIEPVNKLSPRVNAADKLSLLVGSAGSIISMTFNAQASPSPVFRFVSSQRH